MRCQRELFNLPGDYHYLNCAYLSPLLKTVEEAGIWGIQQKRMPWHIKPVNFFEDSHALRSLFARLINAEQPDRIAILPSASYGLSTVAKNLPRNTGKKIIVAGEQFPSNIYPWRRFCKESNSHIQPIKAPEQLEKRGKKWNERILQAINNQTLMVAIAHIHWTDGTLFDLQQIGKRAREVGAYFIVDGTQSISALPFDVQQLQPDALICAGYKWLMGPYSTGLGYFGERFASGIPLEEGWIERKDSENFAGLVNYTDQFQPGAIRYDVGERSNFILLPMMIKALEQILEWKPENLQTYCQQLTQAFTKELPQWGYQIEAAEQRAHHLFGIRLPENIQTNDLQTRLTKNNIFISVRGSALRISPHVYNNEKDITTLRKALINV